MDVTPLPRIQSILEELRGKTLFSKFDIRAGYNNIRIAEGDEYKTRFKTNKGLFKWVVMPFGLCNTPGTFTRMGNDILRPLYAKYPGKFRHYMDNCIVMTGTGEWELHVKICHDFFEILEQHNLFLKPAKCEFFQTAVDYLGIRVEGGELMIDPAKIAGIKEWPTTLKTVKEVRSTLGLLGYHRPWIPNFARIAKPLTDLLQKGKEFAWDTACETAVRKLIGLVTSGPVLIPPDPDQQFILYVDASQFATGAILYQANKEQTNKRGDPLLRPIGFHSQTFTKTEQNYPIYDRELLAVIRGLRTWRHLLRNTVTPVLVITDHANLQYYQEPHKLGL
jgi:RNase H-like domain found in reverse transcriptase/Reverse transcriptase (RNA-dependent DNA polymerase)